MKCERCGNPIGNKIYRYNNTILCPDCAKELGMPDVMPSAFKMFESDIMNVIPQVFGNLEFSPTRSQIKCPKCGTSLKDLEMNGFLGCIECYNTFNDQISRALMRTQANVEHLGRKPGVVSDSSSLKKVTEVKDFDVEELKAAAAEEESINEDKLSRLANSDLGMLSDEELKDAIKLAVETENYLLAARFRDELKGREGN